MEENVFEIPKFQTPKISPRLIGLVLVAVIVLLILFSSLYQVEAEQVGVVLRLGRFVRTTDPGLHLKFPYLEEVFLVPVQRQLKEEFGFRTVEAGIRSRYRKIDDESLMLTGDLNVAVVEWIVQFRVTDPYKFLFKVRDIQGTFRAMTEAVVREVVGDRTVTEVLTVGRQDIEATVTVRLQELCNQYETGISVDQVVLQDVTPPDPVKPSWDEVNQAQQQRDRLINEARRDYNTVIPRAEGEAKQVVLQAEGYATNRVNRSQGDAKRFVVLSEEFRKAPAVTRQRMYLETMEKVIPRVGGRIFLDESAEGVLPLLPLDVMQKVRQLPATTPPKQKGGDQ